MLNEFLILQLLIIILACFFYKIYDSFNLILASTSYLIITSLYLFLLDGDIFISFLLILDLGVFFIFFAFLMHLTSFLTNKNYLNYSFSTTLVLVFFLPVTFVLLSYNNSSLTQLYIDCNWYFLLTHYNFYSLLNSNFQSEMNLLREVYFYHNYFEFFFLSVAIYYSILLIQIFLNLLTVINTTKVSLRGYTNKNNSTFFFKKQDFNKQSFIKATSRVWKSTKNKFYGN